MQHMRVLDSGQTSVEPLEFERQALVVQPQQVQQRGVEIAHVRGFAGNVVAEFASLAVRDAPLDAATCKPH